MRDWDWLRPHTLNLYQYCGNDPINHWDPNGFQQTNEDIVKYLNDRKQFAKVAEQASTQVPLGIAKITVNLADKASNLAGVGISLRKMAGSNLAAATDDSVSGIIDGAFTSLSLEGIQADVPGLTNGNVKVKGTHVDKVKGTHHIKKTTNAP